MSKVSTRITDLIKPIEEDSQVERVDLGRQIENFIEFDDEQEYQEWLKELQQEKQSTNTEEKAASSIKEQIQKKRKTKSVMNNDSNVDISQRIVKMSRVERDIERVIDPKIGLPYLPSLFEEEFNSKYNYDAAAISLELASSESLSIRLKHLLKLYSRWYKTILPQYSVTEAAEVVEDLSKSKKVVAVRQEQREKFYGYHKAAYSTQKHHVSNYVSVDSKKDEQIIGKITAEDEEEFDFAKEQQPTKSSNRRVVDEDEEEEFQFIATQDTQHEMPPPASKKKTPARRLKKKNQKVEQEEEVDTVSKSSLSQSQDGMEDSPVKRNIDEGEEEFQFDEDTTMVNESMEVPLASSNTLSFSLDEQVDVESQDAVEETPTEPQQRNRLKRKRK